MTIITDQAIDQSRERDEIVHLTAIEIAQAGETIESVHRALFAECEGEALNGSTHEYWGHGTDGPDDSPWRVHVPAEGKPADADA